MNNYIFGTINETYNRCKTENIGISKSHLRRLCKTGAIPVLKSGNRFYINWYQLLEYLYCKPQIYKKETEPDKSNLYHKLDKPKIRKLH